MAELQQQYAEVRYNDFITPLTDPATLGALGRMFGLHAADPASGRVLELGCGQGLNLIAMAARFPDAHFVGVDFIEAGLQEGRALAQAAGLSNIELIHADLLDFEWQGEAFDYVIAWGVFSWVPDDAKDRLLAVARACLAPEGLACICYLTYPGCKSIEPLRDLMRLRASAVSGFQAQVAAARAALQTLQAAHAGLGRSVPGTQAWLHHVGELLKKDATTLFHDELGATYDPCYLLQFIEWAQEHGLAYVTDADSPANVASILPAATALSLKSLTGHVLEQEQISDYLTHRTLRVSLLTRDEASPRLQFTPAAIGQLCLDTRLKPRSDRSLLRQPKASRHRFVDPHGHEISVDDRLTAALLHALCEGRGQRRPFADLLEAAAASMGDETGGHASHPSDLAADAIAILGTRLFPMVARKMVAVSLAATRTPTVMPERIRLSPLNRVLAASRGLLATATHEAIHLSTAEAGWLLALESTTSAEERRRLAIDGQLPPHHADQLLARVLAQGCLAADT